MLFEETLLDAETGA